nr:hypothetical protein BaRGS_014599 [Batillaria attramentaria]
MLLVSATSERLLLAAEMQELKKKHTDGFHREVTVQDIEGFVGSVKKYLSRHIVVEMFPLHDEEAIKRLGDEWYQPRKVFSVQPIHAIQQYFGEKIALYFAFLGLYTISLIPPALIGVIYFITSWRSVYREAIFAIFNLVWSTIFLEGWKRYCAELSYTWGTIDTVSSKFEEPRANYHGSLGRNPVTGKPEPVYPKWKRLARFYCVTVPVISFCLAVAFGIMLFYFWMQAWADSLYEGDKGWINFLLLYVPTAIYAVLIGILNGIYRTVAKKLNDFENHRLDSSYENHLVMKLILFDFVNCFICLFYVAFYMQDRAVLNSVLEQTDVADIDASVKKQVVVESAMDRYEGTMDDYLELFLQFGYVYLFSSAFPLAALWAFLNNVTEIRCDAFKMCRIFQRPFAESASNTGAWQVAFEIIGVISVLTNCALIGMDPEVQKLLPSDIKAVNMVLIFVGVERLAAANRKKQMLRKVFMKPAKSTML